MTAWVVRDDRPLDPDGLASAAASQASLGDLLARLRSKQYRELPIPDGEEVAP
ncbi:MAG TPA: hypothetical protein VIR58_01635 [Acidimicrobiales bacterium]